jgi:SAM-dependent methyltransferase
MKLARRPDRTQYSRDLTEFSYAQVMRRMPPKAETILDCGCGRGIGTRILKGNQVVGIDNSPDDLKATKNGNKPQFIQADARKLPFKPSSFDVVCMLAAIEHFDEKDQNRALDEVATAMSTSGVLFLTTPNRQVVSMSSPDHIRELNVVELEALLHKHFHEVEILGFGKMGDNFLSNILKIARKVVFKLHAENLFRLIAPNKVKSAISYELYRKTEPVPLSTFENGSESFFAICRSPKTSTQ